MPVSLRSVRGWQHIQVPQTALNHPKPEKCGEEAQAAAKEAIQYYEQAVFQVGTAALGHIWCQRGLWERKFQGGRSPTLAEPYPLRPEVFEVGHGSFNQGNNRTLNPENPKPQAPKTL